jgi:anti-sigma B factor antagonist
MARTIDLDQQPTYWKLKLAGDLDCAGVYALRVTVDRILASAPPALVVDLSGVEYLDSAGLGLLLVLSREYAGTGQRLVLVTNEVVDTVLSITRLDRVLATAPELGQALELAEGKPA